MYEPFEVIHKCSYAIMAFSLPGEVLWLADNHSNTDQSCRVSEAVHSRKAMSGDGGRTECFARMHVRFWTRCAERTKPLNSLDSLSVCAINHIFPPREKYLASGLIASLNTQHIVLCNFRVKCVWKDGGGGDATLLIPSYWYLVNKTSKFQTNCF